MPQAAKPATTITKVCRVLSEFRNRQCLGITELARRTDLLPSDVHRILASLKASGFVEQNPETRTYHLGVSLMKLGLTVYQQNHMREAARPLLIKLSEQTEATAHLAIFDRRGLEIFLAEQIDCAREIPFQVKYGAPASPHSTALGKAILATLDRDVVIEFVSKSGLRRVTPNTITEMPALLTELDRIAARGYGVDREESAVGACCVGSPIRDWSGAVAGALSVSMAAERFYRLREATVGSAVKTTAARVSTALGFVQVS